MSADYEREQILRVVAHTSTHLFFSFGEIDNSACKSDKHRDWNTHADCRVDFITYKYYLLFVQLFACTLWTK